MKENKPKAVELLPYLVLSGHPLISGPTGPDRRSERARRSRITGIRDHYLSTPGIAFGQWQALSLTADGGNSVEGTPALSPATIRGRFPRCGRTSARHWCYTTSWTGVPQLTFENDGTTFRLTARMGSLSRARSRLGPRKRGG
ncbi:hypothetical protein CCR75_005526 [Bremia lactucae]|uniref:Uncharacterized protein n=1 Tax=Bremia lactucae TaxID=4779 RepID=A0A976FGP0_BRELC|nr:hypothetical protein CCR75_005526 [Bremia lactucae]